MPTHIEHPASRHSYPARRKIASRASASEYRYAAAWRRPVDPGWRETPRSCRTASPAPPLSALLLRGLDRRRLGDPKTIADGIPLVGADAPGRLPDRHALQRQPMAIDAPQLPQ